MSARAALLVAALLGLAAPLPASAQMSGVDMTLPKMTEASLTRDQVVALLDGATDDAPADLSGLWLNGLDLSGLDFTAVNFRAAALNGTNLADATLDRAVLSQSWMIGADLTGASLVEAELFQTQLRGATLAGADFTRARAAADFSKADVTGTIFREADFSADMRNQSMGLMRGVLISAHGKGADFTGASMSRADLEFAKLPGAIFSGADLSMATLGGADLSSARIDGADFTDADLTSTRLTGVSGAESTNLDAAKNLDRAIR